MQPVHHATLLALLLLLLSCRFGFIGPVELSTSAFLFANLGHIPSESWRTRFLAEALKFRVRLMMTAP